MVTCQVLLHDLQSLRGALNRQKVCCSVGLRVWDSVQAVSFWARKVADDREFEVDEMAGSWKLQSAFAVKHVLQSRSQDQRLVAQNEADNAMAEVAIRAWLEVGRPTLTISTWSCYCCLISPARRGQEVRDLKEKTSGDRQQQEDQVAEEVDRSPSCCAPVEFAAVSPPVEEATSEGAFRD